MAEIYGYLSGVFIFVILAIPGVIFTKKKLITGEQVDGLSSILLNVFWPAMIIDAMYMVNDGDTRIIKDGIFVAIVTFCIYLICIVTAYCVFSQLNCLNKIKGMCAFAVALSNTGLIGMPFIKEVYGNEALFYATIMEAVNDVFIFTIGSIIIKQDITDKDKIDTNKMSVADVYNRCTARGKPF